MLVLYVVLRCVVLRCVDRYSCHCFIHYFIHLQLKEIVTGHWSSLSPAFKAQLRSNALGALASPDVSYAVSSGLAQLLCIIAKTSWLDDPEAAEYDLPRAFPNTIHVPFTCHLFQSATRYQPIVEQRPYKAAARTAAYGSLGHGNESTALQSSASLPTSQNCRFIPGFCLVSHVFHRLGLSTQPPRGKVWYARGSFLTII